MGFDFYEWSQSAFLKWKTARHGERVGEDRMGNLYYRDRRTVGSKRERRWVVFKGESEASLVPPEWHAWLHHQVKAIPDETSRFRQPWQKEHVPNMTGTPEAYRPPGHLLEGGKRDRATGDYEPWTPS